MPFLARFVDCHDFIGTTFSLTSVYDAADQIKKLTISLGVIRCVGIRAHDEVCEIEAADWKIDN